MRAVRTASATGPYRCGAAGPAGNTGVAQSVSVHTGSTKERKDVAHEYEEARDRTGQAFRLVPHSRAEIKADLKLFRDPGAYGCPCCGALTEFKILADMAPGDSNIVMIGCHRCNTWLRAMELRVPQMDDSRAKSLGIWLPNTYQPSVEFDVDFDG